jgi:SAM-dependent methyltransferase
MTFDPHNYDGNVARFSGFADLYDRYRAAPPDILAELLTRLSGVSKPNLVVDLGSGTGLSTRFWRGKSSRVIGIEPTADMRVHAGAFEIEFDSDEIQFLEGYSYRTGLPDNCADIVTCAQSLHWMEPQSTFHEIQRILKPGGVFSACDYDWPPTTGSWEAELAYETCIRRALELEQARGTASTVRRWDKPGHLGRMAESGCFQFVKEIAVHHTDTGNADRLVGLALSQGMVMSLLKQGGTEEEIGLDELRTTANRTLGSKPQPWVWTSRVRFGIVS